MYRARRVVGVLVVSALSFLGLWWLQKDHDQRTQPAHTHPSQPAAPQPPVSAEPVPVEDEPIETFGTPGGLEPAAEDSIRATVNGFVEAWLTPDPTSRGIALQPYSTPELLEGLVNTRPDKIPQLTPHGDHTLVRTGPWGAEARQQFTDHSEIALLIVPHPDSPTQWAVASVRNTS